MLATKSSPLASPSLDHLAPNSRSDQPGGAGKSSSRRVGPTMKIGFQINGSSSSAMVAVTLGSLNSLALAALRPAGTTSVETWSQVWFDHRNHLSLWFVFITSIPLITVHRYHKSRVSTTDRVPPCNVTTVIRSDTINRTTILKSSHTFFQSLYLNTFRIVMSTRHVWLKAAKAQARG